MSDHTYRYFNITDGSNHYTFRFTYNGSLGIVHVEQLLQRWYYTDDADSIVNRLETFVDQYQDMSIWVSRKGTKKGSRAYVALVGWYPSTIEVYSVYRKRGLTEQGPREHPFTQAEIAEL